MLYICHRAGCRGYATGAHPSLPSLRPLPPPCYLAVQDEPAEGIAVYPMQPAQDGQARQAPPAVAHLQPADAQQVMQEAKQKLAGLQGQVVRQCAGMSNSA
jgi:hypothetical protein